MWEVWYEETDLINKVDFIGFIDILKLSQKFNMITKEDREIYERIIFQPCDIEAEIEGLDLDQRKTLATFVSQKVAF